LAVAVAEFILGLGTKAGAFALKLVCRGTKAGAFALKVVRAALIVAALFRAILPLTAD
jgi:hypothetical protein